jgi:hypothetical protein
MRAARPDIVIDFIGVGPLVVSSLARWLFLPRLDDARHAFVLFVVGVALAESGGIIGLFLSSFRRELFAVGLLGVVQWVPLFTRRFYLATAGPGADPRQP